MEKREKNEENPMPINPIIAESRALLEYYSKRDKVLVQLLEEEYQLKKSADETASSFIGSSFKKLGGIELGKLYRLLQEKIKDIHR